MKIEFIDKDQIWTDEQTNYWFLVDGESYAIADQNGTLRLLDRDGCPMDDPRAADHDRIKDALLPHYEAHIND